LLFIIAVLIEKVERRRRDRRKRTTLTTQCCPFYLLYGISFEHIKGMIDMRKREGE